MFSAKRERWCCCRRKHNSGRMRIIHTADWHIGQNFFGYDRKEEHRLFLDWLASEIRSREADVLLVAGDIFDGPNPSADSQRLYFSFLSRLIAENPALQVVIIAGNHDSAARLEAVAPLLETQKVFIRGLLPYASDGEIDYDRLILPLQGRNGEKLWCLAVPYLKIAEMEMLARQEERKSQDAEKSPKKFSEDVNREKDDCSEESERQNTAACRYKRGMNLFFDRLTECLKAHRMPGQAAVIVAHLQATGSEVSQEDRAEKVMIGGEEAVWPEAFDREIEYVALGHLHRAQQVSHRPWVRYAGAPLPMSFAESHYRQGVRWIEIGSGRIEREERIDFEAPVKMIRLPEKPQPFEQVKELLSRLPLKEDGGNPELYPFVEVRIQEAEPSVFMKEEIARAVEGKAVRLAKLSLTASETPGRHTDLLQAVRRMENDPLLLAQDHYRNKYGKELPERLTEKLRTVIRDLQ